MAQHRPSKPAPVEYSTDEEDMIVYDVDEDAIESNPDYYFCEGKSCRCIFLPQRGIHPDPEIRIRDIQIPVVPDVRFLGAKEPFPIPTLEYATVPLYQPFATYSKSTVAPVVFQRVFAYHRSQYNRYSAIYTDGSKRADYVGCGVVIEDIMHGYRLDTSCSVFTAEAVAIYRALQLIDSNMPRKYCIYTDSMSVQNA
ncbi:pggt1b [Trichonephila clavipes]|nr:pggt1b [Trichonephila clavipes]